MKIGFDKSFIFQLIPFFTAIPGLVIILIPLKLLQAEQNTMINQIFNAKSIVLNGENNQISMHKEIARGNYIHLFTNPKITLLKKFTINILDHLSFSDRFCLLAIDEICNVMVTRPTNHMISTRGHPHDLNT